LGRARWSWGRSDSDLTSPLLLMMED